MNEVRQGDATPPLCSDLWTFKHSKLSKVVRVVGHVVSSISGKNKY